MIITQNIKSKKLTSISLTFDTDEEIGCLEDIVALVSEQNSNHLREELVIIINQIKKVL